MKILLMGPQGCGKGTIGELLSKHLSLPVISTGDLLRHLPTTHKRYAEVQATMERGDLVDQSLVAEILKDHVNSPECAKGYILDGWCRNLIDLNCYDPFPDVVLLIKISRETSLRRLSGRRMCTSDGKIYNILTLPKEELAKCMGELVQRKDDTPDAINERLDIYYSDTQKVIEVFNSRGVVIEIDGEPEPAVVFENVKTLLKL